MIDRNLVSTLKRALQFYIEIFGKPDSLKQLEGIVGSFLAIQQQAGDLSLATREVQDLVRQVIEIPASEVKSQPASNESIRSLVEATHHRREVLESHILETLNAYIQNFAPNLSLDAVQEKVTDILAILEDGTINQAEASSFIQKVGETFQVEAALGAAVGSKALEMGRNLALAIGQKNLEEEVRSALAAYLEKYEPSLEQAGETLIEQAIRAVTRTHVEFDWDADINLEEKKLLIKQVAFKFNIMQASPPASKSAENIADQINSAIQEFQASRQDGLELSDQPASTLNKDELSISSTWDFENT